MRLDGWGKELRKQVQKIILYILASSLLAASQWGAPAAWAQRLSEGTAPSDTSLSSTAKPATSSAERKLFVQTFLFGVLNDNGDHFTDQWGRGVRATSLELQWKQYEPEQGVYDWDYINHLRARLRSLKQQGWYVQLIPGVQYAPDWVFANYPGMHYINQYGEAYDPDPLTQGDFRVINAPFNPQARTLIAGYLEHVLTQSFPQSDPEYIFNSLRIGGGPQGELRYPPATWNGHNNSYWAFDAYAQDPAQIAAIPAAIAGWRPGVDPNPGTQGAGQLLVNPGFEISYPNYSQPGWTPDDEVKILYSHSAPHSGQNAMQLTLATPNRVHQFVRVEAGTNYRFGGWVKSGDGLGRPRLFAIQYGADHLAVPGAPFVKLESPLADWVYVEGSLTTSASTRFLKIELDGDRPGAFYFDDLWLAQEGATIQQSRSVETPVAFYDWYVQAMTAYQNWQIATLRQYYSGQIDVVYAGKGLQTRHIMGALTNDLLGDSWSETSSALYAGAVYERHIAALSDDGLLAIFLTGIEAEAEELVNDNSPYSSDWSAAHWLSALARRQGLSIWGENSGRNDAAGMWLAARRMHANGFSGLMWGFASQLYADPNADGYATIEDYQAVIAYYSNVQAIGLPFLVHGNSSSNVDAP